MRASRHLCYVIALLVLHVGCTPQAVFPPDMQEKIDRTISVDVLKRDPNAYRGVKIELGGKSEDRPFLRMKYEFWRATCRSELIPSMDQ